MTDKSCPACGHPASGPFCSQCGARVAATVNCASCGNEIPPGGKFCNQCGTAVGGPGPAAVGAAAAAPTTAPRAASTLPWVVTAFALLALVIALVFPRPDGDDAAAAPAPTAAPAPGAAGEGFGDARSVDLASMTPRERADNLFNRVMQNVSSGDSTQAKFFMPMALAAYEDVPELDADGHYHMAVLHLAAGDPAAARARADSILADAPDHLFGLFTAAQSEQAMGNTRAAQALYTRFNESFDAETALGRAEYGEHQAVMPMMRQEAREAVAGD
jgi:hypothetical protein